MGLIAHILEQGSRIVRESERLIVKKGDKVLGEIRTFEVSSVFVYGNVQVTTQALRLLMTQGINCAFLTLEGKLIGLVTPVKSRNIVLRLAQYRACLNDRICLYVAKRLVEAKLKNLQGLLKAYLKNWYDRDIAEVVRGIDRGMARIEKKEKVKNLFGIEGYLTASYFSAYGKLFRGELRFGGRNRRPPRDPVNAVLGFGYALLMNEFMVILNGSTLDPYLGFYHGIQYGRPSLALDMMEPFRVIIDRLVLRVCNLRILNKGDFEERGGGVYLTREGMKKFLKEYQSYIKGFSYRDKMCDQVDSLLRYIRGGGEFAPVILF